MSKRLKIFPKNFLNETAFKNIFLDQLGTMHCALTHLSSNIESLSLLTSFSDLRFALEETQEDTFKQLVRIEKIAETFKMTITEKSCLGVKAIMEETLLAIGKTEKKSFERDLAIIFYMHVIKHIEVAGYRTLVISANKLNYDSAKILLTENMDEAIDNDKLFMLISDNYALKSGDLKD
ncbi:DUF892 family protein [Mucilaginibacter sp.]|uniref:DUF892 family protein n=1 Tax=Mucilaginibacter sp. TaxID=1882438 RepID=UPI003D10D59F